MKVALHGKDVFWPLGVLSAIENNKGKLEVVE